MGERIHAKSPEALSTRRLIEGSVDSFTNDFPRLHPPYGLVDASGVAIHAIESYGALAEYSAFSLIHALGRTCEAAGLRSHTLSTEQKAALLKPAEAPINGMHTTARLFEVIPEVLRINHPFQPYSAEELVSIAENSTDIPLLLASSSSYHSRLLYASLALAPHPFYSKDGLLIQRDKLDPSAVSLTGEGSQRKLVVAQPDRLEAKALALHEQLVELTDGNVPDFNERGRCPAYNEISAIQQRMAHVAGATIFQREAQMAMPQLPGEKYFDEGPAIVRVAIAHALENYIT